MVALAPFSAWPWENIGTFKYLLYGPFLWKVLHSRFEEDGSLHWCFHILAISTLRCFMFQCWTSYSNMHFLARNRRILPQGVDFKQIDNERNWDNFIILQALIGSMGLYTMSPKVGNLPVWDARGIMVVIILHIGVSEPLYYFGHRWFHRSYLFTHYHSLHHSSPVPQPFTAGYGTFLEQILFAMVIGIPVVGCYLIGYGSLIMIYSYVLIFDLLRCLGYSNVEIVPYKIFDIFPFLRYVLYSPTYYSLHHTEIETNYCLFLPLFDALGNTLNTKSWELHKKIRLNLDKSESIPDFVFLIHIVDLTSFLHGPIFFRQFTSEPFSTRLWLLPLWPVSFLIMLVMWAKGKTTLTSFYNLRGKLHHTWVVPRYGFQYLLPFAREGINKKIEEAILAADKLGVKFITLGGLNKNEALNGGGILFVEKHPNLKARVVHGNTLTAAIILKEIHEDVKEVFLAGATSKLGRAIALYLSRRRVRVLMLTLATERYEKIKNEATADCQKYLVQVTTYQAARSCKTWIIGKWVTPREQSWAPSGTHFHQFVVPPILAFRRDCTYGDLAAMRLPEDVQGLGCCEYTMERGIVHACHAGGVVHTLEGWSHHEVGAIDVDRIDVVWEAALKHGLKPVSSG